MTGSRRPSGQAALLLFSATGNRAWKMPGTGFLAVGRCPDAGTGELTSCAAHGSLRDWQDAVNAMGGTERQRARKTACRERWLKEARKMVWKRRRACRAG